jgi:hypothetical protein
LGTLIAMPSMVALTISTGAGDVSVSGFVTVI